MVRSAFRLLPQVDLFMVDEYPVHPRTFGNNDKGKECDGPDIHPEQEFEKTDQGINGNDHLVLLNFLRCA